jgi:hypothetical protein
MTLFLPVVEAFNREQVSYVIVGGLATVLHGHLRLTADVDFVISLERENILKSLRILKGLGYVPRSPIDPQDFSDAAKRLQWMHEKGMLVFSFFNQANPLVSVDLFCDYPADYTTLLRRSIEKSMATVSVRICSLGDLIDLKRAAGRPIDLDDLKHLEIIRGQE